MGWYSLEVIFEFCFAVVVSGFGLTVSSGRTPVVLSPCNIITLVTRCSDQRCHLKFGTVVTLFKYINVYVMVDIGSLYIVTHVRMCSSF